MAKKDLELASIVRKNIASLAKMQRLEENKKGRQEKIADLLTRFSGSMAFVYAHALWFGIWIMFNTGLISIKPFDPFPFSLLTLLVSLEAIFLSTFVLISQNHAGRIDDKRADLDLQINLLSEHEITRLLIILDGVAKHLGIAEDLRGTELEKDTGIEEVLEEIATSKM